MYVTINIYRNIQYGVCGLELGIVSVDIIFSCQCCSYSRGGVVTEALLV